MKKIKLFLAAFAAMVGLSASAQTNWTGVSEITSGQEYYIVNDATGFFVTPGNNWGTRATLDESPAGTATVTLADGKYTIIFTWPSHGNGLFVNTDDGSEVFCDRNNQANYFWTINSNGDNTFSIQLASDQARYKEGSYLTAESASIWANVQYNSGNAELRKWRFISPTEVKSSMSSSTSKLDVSLFVHGAQGTTNLAASNNSFDRFKERYSWTVEGAGWKGQNNQTLTGFNRYWLECWNNESLTSRSAKKTVSSLPAGSYTLSAYTVGGNGVTFYAKVGEGEKITAATGNGTPILSTVNFDIESESANVEIGIESTAESTSGWIAIDNIKLEYVSFSAFRSVYEEALQAAQDASAALDGFSVYATQKTTLDGSISSNTLTGDDLNSRSALTAATTALENATAAVAAQVAACQQYANIASAIAGGTNVDLTSYVVNAGFEQGNLNGWTSADAGGIANNTNFSQKVGTYFVERWQANNNSQVQLSNGTLTHDPIVLPAGIYEISATGQVQEQKNGTTGGGYFLCANSERVEMGAPARYSTYVVVEDKSELIIKFALDGCTGNWISCDDVQLTYVGTDFPAYTLVDGKMSSAASTAQSSAESTYLSDKTVTNYNALIAAITAAQASKDAYAIAATAIADAKTLQANYTFVTPAAASTFAEAIAAIETPYNEGSLADANASAAGRTLGVVMVDWHASATNTAASNYMISAWPNTYTINDWSREGNDDGSNFKVPFFQDWIADGESLAAKTMTGTLTGLENGLYSVSALVRVRAKNEIAAADATGITMDINGGGEGDYAAVDVTAGEQIGSSQFQIATYTAQGLVKNGTLTLNFNVAAGNNISWLSFKNVKYTKVRDLTPEEAFVPATAEDYAALNAAVEAHTLGFEAGEYAPYNNIEAAATIAAAKAIDQDAENAREDVQTATAAITGATWTANVAEVNAIYNGDFAIAAHDGQSNAQPTGWYRNDGTYTGDGYNVRYVTIPSGVEGNTSEKGLFGKFTMKYGAKAGYSLPLKQGYYKLTFSYGGWNEVGAREVRLYNNDNTATVEVSTVTAANNTAHTTASSWRAYSSLITVPAAGDYTLSFYRQNTSSQNQFVLTDIVLVKATAADFKDALLAEITTASAVDVATNVGEGVFQIPASATTALTTAISDAQDVYDDEDATIDEVLTATESVKAAVETYSNVELNAPDAEKIYALTIVDEGKAWNGNAVTFIAGARNDQGGYGIKYLAPTNVNLAQGLKLTKTTGNNYKISVTKADGTQQYITTAKLGHNTGDNSQIRTTDDVEKALEVEVRLNGDGQFLLWNTAQNAAIANNNNNDMYTSRTATFNIVETTKPSITINTTAAGWGTTILPFAVASLPEGVKAYTCAEVDGTTLTLVEVTALEANKPYIIEGAWNETLTGDAQGTALTYTEGLLTGVYTSTVVPAGKYVLQNNDKVAFYLVGEGEEPTAKANRAYLTAPAASGVKAAAYYFGTTTAIRSLFSGLQNGDVYDLAGRKVQKMQKGGVYIVNGQKVAVK